MKEQIIATISFLLDKINEMALGSMTNTVNTLLKFNNDDGRIVTIIIDYLSPIAFSLIVVYFLIGLAEQYTHVGREITMDSIIKAFAGLMVADIMINASYKIVELMMNLTNKIGPDMMNEYTTKFQTEAAKWNALSWEGKKINLIGALLVLLCVVMGFGISLLCNIIIGFLCMSTKLEIMVRYSFAPLGLANLANSNEKSSALKYLRKMLACSFYGGALCVVLICAMHLGTASSEIAKDYRLTQSEKIEEVSEELQKEIDEEVLKQINAKKEELYQNAINNWAAGGTAPTDQSILDGIRADSEKIFESGNYEEKIKESVTNDKTTKKTDREDEGVFTTAIDVIVTCLFQVLAPIAAIGAVSAAKSVVNEAFGA